MGQILTVTCRECGTTADQIDGPVMMGFNPRCTDCGSITFVSLDSLYVDDPPELDPASDEAWRLRYERITTIAGPCECGGTFSEDAPLRCNSCRSTHVGSVTTAMVD